MKRKKAILSDSEDEKEGAPGKIHHIFALSFLI